MASSFINKIIPTGLIMEGLQNAMYLICPHTMTDFQIKPYVEEVASDPTVSRTLFYDPYLFLI